jgi:hypothetical protein
MVDAVLTPDRLAQLRAKTEESDRLDEGPLSRSFGRGTVIVSTKDLSALLNAAGRVRILEAKYRDVEESARYVVGYWVGGMDTTGKIVNLRHALEELDKE